VLQIQNIALRGVAASDCFLEFEKARDNIGAGLVSCRISHADLRESMFLEEHGFRFIEMVYYPEFDNFSTLSDDNCHDLSIENTYANDIPFLAEIAGSVFRNERFFIDHRLDTALGNLRYQNWIKNAFEDSSQQLLTIRDKRNIVAFFVTEMMDDGLCYWHLNAVSPDFQSQGYGKSAWTTMLKEAHSRGANKVRTCIAARNYRVLNLYSRLGFYFSSPSMTFHWVRT
jgi:ribosomal protein S18 acetylase RimI-like enzyme